MAQADSNHTTKLSSMFRDPFLRAVFQAAEDDGLAPAFAENRPSSHAQRRRRRAHDRDHRPPRSTVGGGVNDQARPTTGRRADCRARIDSGRAIRAAGQSRKPCANERSCAFASYARRQRTRLIDCWHFSMLATLIPTLRKQAIKNRASAGRSPDIAAGRKTFEGGNEDDENDLCDEPSLGALEQLMDQVPWGLGNRSDREADPAEDGIADEDGMVEQLGRRDWQPIFFV